MKATQRVKPERSETRSVRELLLATLPVTERQLTLNGVSTAVLEGGAGMPVILLHGPGGYGAQWIDVIPDLVRSHRVVAPDLPGHGASEFFDEGELTEQANAWLDDLIECTCSQPPVLVGHTLGGAIAARFAAANDKRAAALILVDSLGLTTFQPEPAFGSALQAFIAAPDGRTHDDLWGQCTYEYENVKRRIGSRWSLIKAYNLANVQRPEGMAALMAWMHEIGSPEIPAATLRRISIPTTLIWGRMDRATSLGVAQAASSKFGWPLLVIEGAADDPTIEQPAAFLATLRGVLGGMPS